jgi:hypothetical protein
MKETVIIAGSMAQRPGLLTFISLDEAVCGVRGISRNYTAHSRAASDIAVEYSIRTKCCGNWSTKFAKAFTRAPMEVL